MRLREIMTKQAVRLTLTGALAVLAGIAARAPLRLPCLAAEEKPVPESQRDVNQLQQQLQEMIESLDGIAKAKVVFNAPERAALFRQPFRPHASVLITTKNSQELPHFLAGTIRSLIAHATNGLQESDIALSDQTGRMYPAPATTKIGEVDESQKKPFDEALALARLRARLERKIAGYDEIDGAQIMLPLSALRENLNSTATTRAIIYVTTRTGNELSRPLQEQIRKLVASSCESLQYEEVLIVDERNRRYYGAPGLPEVWRDPHYGWDEKTCPAIKFMTSSAAMNDALQVPYGFARILASGFDLNSDFCFPTTKQKCQQIPPAFLLPRFGAYHVDTQENRR